MRHIFTIMAFGSITASGFAQSEHGQVAQRIEALRSAGGSFQGTTLFTEAVRSTTTDALWDDAIAEATVLQLRPADVEAVMRDQPAQMALYLPFEGTTIALDLERASITTDEFSVIQASTGTEASTPAGVHYRGMQRGVPGSVVAISVFEGEVMGMISGDAGDLVLGRLQGSNNATHVLYRREDLRDAAAPSCGTVDDGLPYTEEQLQGGPKTLKCVRFYWEVNHDIFLGKGSVALATTYVTGLFNQSATLYANDGITVALHQVFVWVVPSPYTATTTGGLLGQFGDYRTSFSGDLAHLLGYVGGGGVAYVNTICNGQTRYRMAYSDINSTYSNVPSYSWSVEVVTHEQGHLLGSKHTHACAWNGNNTAIDGCGPAAGYSEGSCAAGPVPSSSVGGTIMSYYHLTSAGIKFSNGFGPQPTTLITNNVNGASCLGSGCGTTPPACAAPSGLVAGSVTATSAALSWGSVAGASTYTLQWKPTAGSVYTTVTGSTSTSYQLNGLTPSTAYHFQVLAVCASGSSANAPLASFTTTGGTCTDAYEPNGVTPKQIASNVTLTALISSGTDLDWFRFSNTSAQRNIKVTLTGLPADYNLRLYRSSSLLASSLNSGTANDQVVYNTSTVSTNYRVRVNGANGAFNTSQCYTLTVQISGTPFSMQGLEGMVEGGLDGNDDTALIGIHPNPASTLVTIVLPPADVPSAVELLDGTGRLVGSWNVAAIEGGTNLVLDVSDRAEGLYMVRVERGGESVVQRLVVVR
ncbi:MAG: fibronectin type III domain-containing protein [Flavobacteriales bacterium]|nr:fibronectin type III domain-containing protein [Flavobacteriales bacterium]